MTTNPTRPGLGTPLGAGYDNLTGADIDRLARRLSAPGATVCTQPGDCTRRDALALLAETRRLRVAHAALLTIRHADLLAAARATLSAHRDGEADPLLFLRDELDIDGHDDPDVDDDEDLAEDLDELLTELDAPTAVRPVPYLLTDAARPALRRPALRPSANRGPAFPGGDAA